MKCQVLLGEVKRRGEVKRHFSSVEALEDLRPLVIVSRAVSSRAITMGDNTS
jgi:hypothetical protein